MKQIPVDNHFELAFLTDCVSPMKEWCSMNGPSSFSHLKNLLKKFSSFILSFENVLVNDWSPNDALLLLVTIVESKFCFKKVPIRNV